MVRRFMLALLGVVILASAFSGDATSAQTAPPAVADERIVLTPSRIDPQLRFQLDQALGPGVNLAAGSPVIVDRDELWEALSEIEIQESEDLPVLNFDLLGPRFRLPAHDAQLFRQPIDTAVVGLALGKEIAAVEQECRRPGADRAACRTRLNAMRTWQTALQAVSLECTKKIGDDYRRAARCPECDKDERALAFRAFDDACMAGTTPWLRPDGRARMDPEPAVFKRGVSEDGRAGALGAVGFLQYLTKAGTWDHLCAALLMRPNAEHPQPYALTARHCFTDAARQRDLQDGRIRLVRAVSDTEVYRPAYSDAVARQPVLAVADDVVALDLVDAPAELDLPAVVFEEPGAPFFKPVVVLSYFIHHQSRERWHPRAVAGVSPDQEWRRGIRWARSGLCQVVAAKAGCVRTLCQTTVGYSGAPVFAESPRADGALVVHGLISHAGDGNQPNCFAPDPFELSDVGLRPTFAALPTSFAL